MKFLRCVDPTKYLIKGETYLCRLVFVLEIEPRVEEHGTEDLFEADYVYVQTVYGAHGGNLRVRADRFEEISNPPSSIRNHYYNDSKLNYMQKQIEPVYNFCDFNLQIVKTGLTKEDILQEIKEYSSYETVIDDISTGNILIEKVCVVNNEIVIEKAKLKVEYNLS